MDLVFMYCPIREISVERGGTKVKRFFVSEARRDELGNLTEYRQSGTPGDCSGASFWYFLREKVQRYFCYTKSSDSILKSIMHNKIERKVS